MDENNRNPAQEVQKASVINPMYVGWVKTEDGYALEYELVNGNIQAISVEEKDVTKTTGEMILKNIVAQENKHIIGSLVKGHSLTDALELIEKSCPKMEFDFSWINEEEMKKLSPDALESLSHIATRLKSPDILTHVLPEMTIAVLPQYIQAKGRDKSIFTPALWENAYKEWIHYTIGEDEENTIAIFDAFNDFLFAVRVISAQVAELIQYALENTDEVEQYFTEHKEYISAQSGIQGNIFDYVKYFSVIYKNSEIFQGKTLEEFNDIAAKDPDSKLWAHAFRMADELRNAFIENGLDNSGIQRVKTTHSEEIDFPLDKVNSSIFNLFAPGTLDKIRLKAEKRGSDSQVDIIYSINFDNLKDIVPGATELDAFDKRVYIAVASLYSAGNEYVSESQIYKKMGLSSRPNQKQIERLDNSLNKLLAIFKVDNRQEAKAGYKMPVWNYTGILLPHDRVTVFIDGKLVNGAIHILREPPLITFAKERKQITKFPASILNAPLNMTNSNLIIQDYLMQRVAHAKNRYQSSKILYSTVYEKNKSDNRLKRQRTRESIDLCLGHFKLQGVIKGYKKDKDGVTLILND